MSKNVLVGINGLAREAENLWVGVDGKARRVKSAYIGVNGVARKFWPNIIYVWNRYGVNALNNYSYSRYPSRDIEYHVPGYVYDIKGNRLSNPIVYYTKYIGDRIDQILESDNGYIGFNVSSKFDASDLYDDRTIVMNPRSTVLLYTSPGMFQVANNGIVYRNDSNSDTVEMFFYYSDGLLVEGQKRNMNIEANLITIDSVEYQQGTYIDQVFSEESSTYPQNGKQGNYWYVYQGTMDN